MSIEDLKIAAERGGLVVIAGAGCSIAATGNSPTSSWNGLIEHGIEFALTHGNSSQRWASNVQEALKLAIEDGEPRELLQAASNVAAKVKGMGAQAYANWIRDAIGELPLADRTWPEAVISLGAPIFTTNYDDIFERVSGFRSVDWRDARGFQRILGDGSTAIGHLHGYFDEPESVVLSEADYGRQASSEGIQAIQKAVSASKSILYIGCGGTLEDPNFNALLQWHRETFVDSGTKHFRLCLQDEVAGLQKEHRDSNIEPLSYGANYSDLPEFINTLIPQRRVARTAGGAIRDIIGDSRAHLLDQIRQETIVGEGLIDLDNRPIEDLVVPPIFQPIPHQELVKTKPNEKPKRLSAEDVLSDGVVLLIADDGAGLSTAMRWLLLEASSRRQMPPIQLDFRTMPAGLLPLTKRLISETYQRGLIGDKRDTLPPHVLGIDDYQAGKKSAERVAAELASTTTKFVVLGCSTTDEAEVTDLLKRSGVTPRVVYLGKFGSKEVRAMAEIATGSKAEVLTQAVLNTMRTEHLPRTPFTVALLITVMSKAETSLGNISPTGVLDQYVNHLLGRDEANQDSRRSLSAADLESILTDVATVFVRADQGSILYSDIILAMEQFFARFAWDESPRQAFEELLRRRVLAEDGAQVRFTQSSFLHLFVAKAAAKDPALKERLLARPLYYAASITALAALSRNDRSVLERIAPLLDNPPVPMGVSRYDQRQPRDAPANIVELLELEAQERADDVPTDDASDDLDFYDSIPDSDVLPFPVNDDSQISPVVRYIQSLSLVSVVLRDSEEIADLNLKKKVLIDVLKGWGHTSDTLHDDPAYQELIKVLRDQARQASDSDEANSEDDWIEQFASMLPDLLLFSAIQSSLASRKLVVSAREVAELPKVQQDPRIAIPAAILLERIDDLGWDRTFGNLIRPYENTDVVEGFVSGILWMRFFEAPRGSRLESALRDLLVRGDMERLHFDGIDQRARAKTALINRANSRKEAALHSLTSGAEASSAIALEL